MVGRPETSLRTSARHVTPPSSDRRNTDPASFAATSPSNEFCADSGTSAARVGASVEKANSLTTGASQGPHANAAA